MQKVSIWCIAMGYFFNTSFTNQPAPVWGWYIEVELGFYHGRWTNLWVEPPGQGWQVLPGSKKVRHSQKKVPDEEKYIKTANTKEEYQPGNLRLVESPLQCSQVHEQGFDGERCAVWYDIFIFSILVVVIVILWGGLLLFLVIFINEPVAKLQRPAHPDLEDQPWFF